MENEKEEVLRGPEWSLKQRAVADAALVAARDSLQREMAEKAATEAPLEQGDSECLTRP